MRKPMLLMVDRKEGCDCDHVRLHDLVVTEVETGDLEFNQGGYDAECEHGSTVRLATAEDIPDEWWDAAKAAKVLGVTVKNLEDLAFTSWGPTQRERLTQAARRVRDAEQAKAGEQP